MSNKQQSLLVRYAEGSESRLRKTVKEVIHSYRHFWDVFSELLQNSVDAINQRAHIYNGDFEKLPAGEPDYSYEVVNNFKGEIRVEIDVSARSISVFDNGIGFRPTESIDFLLPASSGKRKGKTYGYKGLGLTYCAFISRSFKLRSTFHGDINNDDSSLCFRELFDWVNEERELPSRENADSLDLPEKYNTVIQTQLGGEYVSKREELPQLTHLFDFAGQPNRFKRLEYLLRTKTALGNTAVLFGEEPVVDIDVVVNVKYPNGESVEEEVPYQYWHPKDYISQDKRVWGFEDYIEHKSKAGGRKGFICLYFGESEVEIGKRKRFPCDFHISAVQQGTLTELSKELNLYEGDWAGGEVAISYGVHLGIDGMPSGVRIDNWDTSHGMKKYFVVANAGLGLSGQFDAGRKGISQWYADKISDCARELIQETTVKDDDTFARYAVTELEGGSRRRRRTSEAFSVRAERAEGDREEDLNEDGPLVRAVNDVLSLERCPRMEQEVIAAFQTMIQNKIVKGYNTVFIHPTAVYDAALKYRFKREDVSKEGRFTLEGERIKQHFEVLGEEVLDLEKSSHRERMGFERKWICCEFKQNIKDLVDEIRDTPNDKGKQAEVIDVVVAWEVGTTEVEGNNWIIRENVDWRVLDGVTHRLELWDAGYHETIRCICLKPLIRERVVTGREGE